MDVNAWTMHGCILVDSKIVAWIMHGCILVDSKIVAWTMHVCVLVDSKMNVNAWIRMHECECMDNAWLNSCG